VSPPSAHYSDQHQAVRRPVRELVTIQTWTDAHWVDLWINAEAVAVAALFTSAEPRSIM
jgi:hypothetical protein